MSDEGAVLALGLGGLTAWIGYEVGSQKYAGWEPIIKQHNERLSHIQYFKIIKPFGFISTFPEANTFYSEAVRSYLLGLPNASVPMSIRCLEIGLKQKHILTMQTQTCDLNLYELIEWSEDYIKDKTDIAHGFRILRNLIHTPTPVNEQQALEALVHSFGLLNLLFEPVKSVVFHYTCTNCKHQFRSYRDGKFCYIGHAYSGTCVQCNQANFVTVI